MTDIKHPELTKEELEKIKEGLLARKEQIVKELKEITEGEEGKSHKVKFPEYGSKSDENAQEIDEYTKNLATDKVLESTLRDIDGALKRIEDGTYGICKYCDEPIAKKRLEARAVASACVPCKTKLQNQ